jgi:hypothetical protein
MPLIPEGLLRRIGQRGSMTNKFNRQGAKNAMNLYVSFLAALEFLAVDWLC